MKTRWMALILALLCLVSAAFLLLRPRGGLRAEIWLDGELVETVDLAALTEEREKELVPDLCCLLLMVLSVLSLAQSGFHPFIYFQF